MAPHKIVTISALSNFHHSHHSKSISMKSSPCISLNLGTRSCENETSVTKTKDFLSFFVSILPPPVLHIFVNPRECVTEKKTEYRMQVTVNMGHYDTCHQPYDSPNLKLKMVT